MADWISRVQKCLKELNAAGIALASPASFFKIRHVAIRVDGLDGIGLIHQDGIGEPFRLCVFEPSDREENGVAEIFERTMQSLEELPLRVDEWRSFRAGREQSRGSLDHKKWLGAVATDKQKHVEAIRESCRRRAAGDCGGAWQAAGFDVKINESLPADTPPIAKERLLADFQAIAPDLLAWHLPRDDDNGKWLLKRRSPLFRYDVDKRRNFTFCLLVALPEKRSGRPEIRAEWLEANLQTARLDAVPEYFDTRVSRDFSRNLLGVDAAKAKCLWSKFTSKATALQSLKLQALGDFVAAGQTSNIELDPLILDCLNAHRVAHMCTCCASLDRQLIEWSAVLHRTLTAINLPQLGSLALRDQEQFRKTSKEPIPILPFPLQRHIRKAHVALNISEPARPRLTITTTGSGNRLPIALWQRPVDIDLLREGTLKPGDLPTSVALQLGIDNASR